MRKWFIVFFALMAGNGLFAQQNNLEIKGTGTDLFLEHKVAPKEGFYSIGRMYNVAPKALASYNRMSLETGLSIGQDLKIPLDKNNFVQADAAARTEALIPLYHTVMEKETLYRLGVNYNKVTLASLKKWNHLSSDAVSIGASLIVGFLKVDKSQSPLANSTARPSNEVVAIVPKEEKSIVEKKTEVIEKPVSKIQEPVAEKKNEVAKIPEPVKTEKKETVVPTEPKTVVTTNATTQNSSGGYFRNVFEQQQNSSESIKGTAGVFKSTSGWQDGKYYCFHNNAAPGSIVKITDNASGKSVYAKVLDAIPDIRQNAGLIIVISNAAADELGVGENKFDCEVSK